MPTASPVPALPERLTARFVSGLSLTALLAELGYTHRESATFGCRDVMRGSDVAYTGNYDEVVVWLARTGQIAWAESVRERAERMGVEVAA